MQELIEERNQAKIMLNDCIQYKKKVGRELAQAEYNYKKKRTEWLYIVMMQGYDGSKPIAATSANDFVKGIPEVADLILARDLLKADHDVTQEKIYQLRFELKIIENDIASIRMGS